MKATTHQGTATVRLMMVAILIKTPHRKATTPITSTTHQQTIHIIKTHQKGIKLIPIMMGQPKQHGHQMGPLHHIIPVVKVHKVVITVAKAVK